MVFTSSYGSKKHFLSEYDPYFILETSRKFIGNSKFQIIEHCINISMKTV